MKRDIESEIRQAAREAEQARMRYETLVKLEKDADPIKRAIQAEEFAIACRRMYLAESKLQRLIYS